jgi:hypothetical protein
MKLTSFISVQVLHLEICLFSRNCCVGFYPVKCGLHKWATIVLCLYSSIGSHFCVLLNNTELTHGKNLHMVPFLFSEVISFDRMPEGFNINKMKYVEGMLSIGIM